MAKLHRSASGDGNLIARARAAEAIRADFERELRSSEPDVIDWRDWGRRLSSVLEECLDLLLGGPGANVTVVFEDQSAFLSSTDVGICRAALRIAAGTTPGDPFSVLYRSLAPARCVMTDLDREIDRFAQLYPEPEGEPDPMPRWLVPEFEAPDLAPLAATLPDGTPHADPFLAGRGWQARDGVYMRVPQADKELEAG